MVLRINLNTNNGGYMIVSKMNVLKPLLDSKDSQHLTAYINNNQNVFLLKRHLREVLDTAYEYLAPVMKPEALVRFVAPLHNIIDDTRLLKSLKGNVGVFRNENIFRILSLPLPIEPTCVVASSFHVKPLLRWIQQDREFLILGINSSSASLYYGSQSFLAMVDTVIFPSQLQECLDDDTYSGLRANRHRKIKLRETIRWLNEWLNDLTKNAKPQLFIAGQKELALSFLKDCSYTHTRPTPVWPSFNPDNIADICNEVRSILKVEVKRSLEESLVEFYQAEDLNLANKNIYQIAKAAIKGRVKKLIIADGINIFGKLDRKSGNLAIHPTHLDHEDDDILDDLAQEVLSCGGEVVVASRDEIPKGRPILAIFDRTNTEPTQGLSLSLNPESKIERNAV